MNPVTFRRRRIARFAALLDGTTTRGGRHHAPSTSGTAADDRLRGLAGVSRRLAAIEPLVTPRPEFRSGTRAMLLERAAHELGTGAADPRRVAAPDERTVRLPAGGGPRRPPAGRRLPRTTRTRAAVLIGVAAGAVTLSGISTASGGAMPGDPLYGVKRSTERAQLAFAGSNLGRGELYLEFARTRLAEARAVRADTDAFGDVLGDMDAETRLGVRLLTSAAVERHDAAALRRVGEFADRQDRDLTALAGGPAGTAAEPAVVRSASLLSDVRQRVGDLAAALPCLVEPPPSDDLGPQPVCATQAPDRPAVEPATPGAPAPTAAPAGPPAAPGPPATGATPVPAPSGPTPSSPPAGSPAAQPTATP